jgi:hypothetical protein
MIQPSRAVPLSTAALLALTQVALAAKPAAKQKPQAPPASLPVAPQAAPTTKEPKEVGVQPAAEVAPTPFAFADFSWAPASGHATTSPIGNDMFTAEFRADIAYHYDTTHPQDDTIGGSSEVFRSSEFQVTQLGVGGDFHYDNVIGRLMTQFGMYAETTPRNDASPARGQWNLDTAYRYISEAYGGYHFNYLDGINVEAGIFMSYIGLWSYYNYDNWTYQPSFVSSNTPWFFNGMRVQLFPNEHIKIEPWLVNGWQSYGRFSGTPGGGGQILWRPTGWLSIVGNQYAGSDTLGTPGRHRFHTDDSIMMKVYDNPDHFIDKAAWSLTVDAGCESGGGVKCGPSVPGTPGQWFLGFMAYARVWFDHDLFALTGGGGAIDNPGRYLVLLPPINGATAITGTPYFTENPGDQYKAADFQITGDYMPSQFITFRLEFTHRWPASPITPAPAASRRRRVKPPACPPTPPNTSTRTARSAAIRPPARAAGSPTWSRPRTASRRRCW